MARLPRLAIPGCVHYVLHRGHNGAAIVSDDIDRRGLLAAVREAARAHQTQLHGYAIGDNELHLLLTPDSAADLSRCLQDIGRRHSAAFNRRHGRSGALWDSRYRAAVLEPGDTVLAGLRLVDTLGVGALADVVPESLRSSAGQRLGQRGDDMLVDPPEYWQLGNTPFDREARYRDLLEEGLPAGLAGRIHDAVLHGWALGSPAFISRLSSLTQRPLRPRPRGRPRRMPG